LSQSFRLFFAPVFVFSLCQNSSSGVTVSNKLGVDKIALFLPVPEVQFEPHFPATVQNPVNAATGEPKHHQQLYSTGEQIITGQRAHYNTPDFQFTIAPDRGGGPANCILQFSAGAFSDSNEVPLDRDGVARCARDAGSSLLAAGVDFPVDKARLVRLDLAKNIELSHPVACYSPIFQALSTRKSVNKMDFGGTGFVAGNGQRQWAFYDKGEEMHAKGRELAECPINTLRPEFRMLKGRVIQSTLGSQTLGGLQSAWESLHGVYKRELERDVFRPKMEEKAQASIDFYQEARFVMEGPLKRKFQAFTNDVGLLHMVESLGLDGAKHFAACYLVEDVTTVTGKRQARRIYTLLEKADYAIRMGDDAPEGTPLKELYRELRKAVMAE
jgi:hypothetical protein